jgi:hypothetical protein
MAYWEVLLILRLLNLFYVRRWYSLFYVHLHYVNAIVIESLQADFFESSLGEVLSLVITINKSKLIDWL